MVKLQAKRDNRIKNEVPLKQAEEILNMPQNGGWELDDDNYKFEDGVIKSKGTKGKKEDSKQSDS